MSARAPSLLCTRRFHGAVFVTHRDDTFFADEVAEKISHLRNLRFMTHEIPCSRKDPVELHAIDIFGTEDATIYSSTFEIHKRQKMIFASAVHQQRSLIRVRE